MEEIKEKIRHLAEVCHAMNIPAVEKDINSLIDEALQKRDGEIIEFINSGYNSPASDTGYSICLDDVINFINSK